MWVMIIIVHVGMMGSGNSNAVTSVEFTSKAKCELAKSAIAKNMSGTVKAVIAECFEK